MKNMKKVRKEKKWRRNWEENGGTRKEKRLKRKKEIK